MAINKQIANAIKKSLLKFDFSKITEKCTNEAHLQFKNEIKFIWWKNILC